MNILITSAGKRVSLVKAFQKELRSVFSDGKIITADCNTKLSAACRVSDKYLDVPLITDNNYIDFLIELCKENNIKLIVPTIDTELLILAKSKNRFSEIGVVVLVSSEEFIGICRDKRRMSTFFEENNFKVAKEFPKNLYKFPLFIKPLNGSRSIDTFIINKADDLTDYHFRNDNLIFLEYLDHNLFEEFTCDLYYNKKGILKCVVPRKRIEVRDGEVNKGKTSKNILVHYIEERLGYIEGAKGCLTAQFFKHKGDSSEIYGIEINARFGGGYPLSYLAGANFIKWIINEYLMDREVHYSDDWEDNLLMLRYDSEVLVRGFNG